MKAFKGINPLSAWLAAKASNFVSVLMFFSLDHVHNVNFTETFTFVFCFTCF